MEGFSKKLKAQRALYGCTQKEVADILGISTVSYSNKETGKQEFTLDEANKLAKHFATTVDELFFTY